MAPAFAQSEGDTGGSGSDTVDQSAPDQGSSTPPPPAPLDLSIPGVDTSTPPPDSAAPDASTPDASSPVTDGKTPTDGTTDIPTPPPPAPPPPSGFGSNGSPTSLTPNLFSSENLAPKTDGATGALTQTIPLDIPPGRNGVQPDLSLKYNSQDAEDSVVGYLAISAGRPAPSLALEAANQTMSTQHTVVVLPAASVRSENERESRNALSPIRLARERSKIVTNEKLLV